MSQYWRNADGWFNYEGFYGDILNKLKDGYSIAEVGIYKGRSILFLAEGIKDRNLKVTLYGIDSFKGSPEIKDTPEQIESAYYANIEPLKDYITTIALPSLEAVKQFEDESLDFVYIDAAHDYDNVKADILAWKPKVKKGGILAGHDYVHPPVKRAVDELLTGVVPHAGMVWAVYL
jgi:predicted O-methyltransferase YrrM